MTDSTVSNPTESRKYIFSLNALRKPAVSRGRIAPDGCPARSTRPAGFVACHPLMAIMALFATAESSSKAADFFPTWLVWAAGSLVALGAVLVIIAKCISTVDNLLKPFRWLSEKSGVTWAERFKKVGNFFGRLTPAWIRQSPKKWTVAWCGWITASPAHRTAKCIIVIRAFVLAGFFIQHALRLLWGKHVMDGEGEFWRNSLSKEAFFVAALLCLGVFAGCSLKSLALGKTIDSAEAEKSTRDRARNGLYHISLIDVLIVFLVGLWPPSILAETHLGYFVAAAATWQFRRGLHVGVLFFAIVAALTARWAVLGWVHEAPAAAAIFGSLEAPGYRWLDVFLLNLLPKLGFWGLLSLLCVLLLETRRTSERRHRMAEENEAFYRGLADSLPLEIFVKGEDRQFLYANERMLTLLRTLPCNHDLVCNPIPKEGENALQKKTDADLGLDPAVAEIFEKADLEIIRGGKARHRKLEPDFRVTKEELQGGEYPRVLTTKVPLVDRSGKNIGLVGYCEEPFTESQATFYKEIVDCSPHYFFQKTAEGIFTWANEQFWQDAKCPQLADRKNVSDEKIYPKELALEYRKDDAELLRQAREATTPEERAAIRHEKEEWHRFQGENLKRVWVIKKPMFDSDGKPLGVQGCFYEIESSVARRAWMERTLKDLIPWIQGEVEQILGPVMASAATSRSKVGRLPGLFYYKDHLTRSARLLNLSEWQLKLIGTEAPELAWRSGKGMDAKVFRRLADTLRPWYKESNFKVREGVGIACAEVDIDWIAVVAAVLWINAAQQVKLLALTSSTREKKRIDLELDVKMEGKALVIELANPGAPLPDGVEHPVQLSRPPRKDGTMGVGLELVCRIEAISGGTASCRRRAGNDGAVFRFECPIRN